MKTAFRIRSFKRPALFGAFALGGLTFLSACGDDRPDPAQPTVASEPAPGSYPADTYPPPATDGMTVNPATPPPTQPVTPETMPGAPPPTLPEQPAPGSPSPQ